MFHPFLFSGSYYYPFVVESRVYLTAIRWLEIFRSCRPRNRRIFEKFNANDGAVVAEVSRTQILILFFFLLFLLLFLVLGAVANIFNELKRGMISKMMETMV